MEPIRSISDIKSEYAYGLNNRFNPISPYGYYAYSNEQSDQLKAYPLHSINSDKYQANSENQSGFEEISDPAAEYSVLKEKLFTLTNSLIDLTESFAGKRNVTYARNSRQDRVMSPDFNTKRTMFNAGDIGSALAGSYNMPRLQEGTITINNTVITIDPNVDSFADIISRINGSSADVFAQYDPAKDTLVIHSLSGSKIAITDDSAHFLEESNIAMSTYQESTESLSFNMPGSPRGASDALTALNKFVGAYNAVIEDASISQDIKDRLLESTNSFITNQFSLSPDQKSLQIGDGSLSFDFFGDESKPIIYDLHNSYDAVKETPGLFVGFFAAQNGYADKLKTNIENAENYIAVNQAGEKINISV